MSGHFCSQWPRYLWSGFGFPFFLMLFAVVSPKCNRPSVTLVTWSVRRSILKQQQKCQENGIERSAWAHLVSWNPQGVLFPVLTPRRSRIPWSFLLHSMGAPRKVTERLLGYQKLCTLQVSDSRTMNSRCLKWFLLPPQREERHTHVCSQSLQHPAPHKRPL